MDLLDLYQRELQQLHTAGRDLAMRHPDLAGHLGHDDPDLARLSEAHAFLTAGLHARLDAAAPAFVEALTDLLLPQVLRSIPAATIIEFTPNLSALRARQRIAKHRPLVSRAIDGTACQFRTCFELDLYPLELTLAQLEHDIAAHPRIRLRLRTRDACRQIFADLERLRLYLHHANPAQPPALMQWLCQYCCSITIQCAGVEVARLPPSALVPVGLHTTPAVLPWPDTAPPAHRMVLERFVLPERAHFIDVVGLQTVAPDTSELDLVFTFDRPPPLPATFDPSMFRLHCTPAVNLFEVSATPVHHTPLTHEHLLRPDGLDPKHCEVHHITRVVGTHRQGGQQRIYSPLHDLALDPKAPRYGLRRVGASDRGIDTFIHPREAPSAATQPDELLSIDLVCTNRQLPLRLGPGDVQGTPAGALFRSYTNLCPVSPPVRPPTGDTAHWQLLAHLGVTARNLHEPANLRTLLGLYNVGSRLQTPLARSLSRQISAICSIDRNLVTRILHGVPVRTIRTHIVLDEAGFAGPGQAFVFGALLDQLFAGSTVLLTASEVHVTLQPSASTCSWPSRLAQ